MIRVYLMDKSKAEITKYISRLEFKSNCDELSSEITMSILDESISKDLDIGSIISLEDDKEFLRAIIVKKDVSDNNIIEYKAFDFGFYLNKSKETYQFKNIKLSDAISRVIKNAGIHIGRIEMININIKKIYRNEKLSDIIKDLIDIAFKESKKKYYIEIKSNKFYLKSKLDTINETSFLISNNIKKKKLFEFIISKNDSSSIEDMKNSIKIISSQNNSKFEYIKRDEASISKYGLLQEVKIVDQKDIAKAKNIASNLLNESKKITKQYNLKLIGNSKFKANRVIDIKEKALSGKFKILTANHIVEDGIYNMNLNIEELI